MSTGLSVFVELKQLHVESDSKSNGHLCVSALHIRNSESWMEPGDKARCEHVACRALCGAEQ